MREIEDELNKKKRGIKHTKKVRVLKEFDSPLTPPLTHQQQVDLQLDTWN